MREDAGSAEQVGSRSGIGNVIFFFLHLLAALALSSQDGPQRATSRRSKFE